MELIREAGHEGETGVGLKGVSLVCRGKERAASQLRMS